MNVTDGQTDGQTLHHSNDRVYASHRAVKIRRIQKILNDLGWERRLGFYRTMPMHSANMLS